MWHAGVIHKLNNFGITGELNSWFSSSLSQCKQRVVLDGFTSSYGGLQAGVPQGSVLGPLLFLIFINDIKYSLKSTLSLYADDSLFCKFSNNIHTCNLALNRDLCHIDSWSKQWQVMFSAEKTCDMVLSLRPSSDPPNPLTFSGSHLKSVSTHKHLGVTFSSDLKWTIHVNDIYIIHLQHGVASHVASILSGILVCSALQHRGGGYAGIHLIYFRVALAWLPPRSAACCSTGTLAMMLV